MNMLTVDRLANAIKKRAGDESMGEDTSHLLAEHVLNFFGYSDRIIDNVLHPEDRDTFYMLEDSGLLVTEREETTLYDGREWRIHYWRLCNEVVKELEELRPLLQEMAAQEEDTSIYDDIPDDIWNRPTSTTTIIK